MLSRNAMCDSARFWRAASARWAPVSAVTSQVDYLARVLLLARAPDRPAWGRSMKFLAALVAGFFLAFITMLVVGLALANGGKSSGGGVTLFFGTYALSFLVALTAPTAGKAWRRLLVACGVGCLLLPLSTMIFSGSVAAGQASGAAAAGSALGGAFLTGAAGIVGFFLGAVFLIVGFLCGRSPQVVYVQVQAPADSAASLAGAGR